MIESLSFRIGAVGIGLVGDTRWEYTEQGSYLDFLSAETPHAVYEVKINPFPAELSGHLVFDAGIRWHLNQDGNRWLLWVPSLGRIPYRVGRFTPDFHSGEIFTSESVYEPGKYIFPISYPLGELLVTNLLGTGYGIILHSCGIIDNDNGIVFAGIGMAGKTTISHLWNGLPGVRVLNDDRTILRKMDGQFRVYGTPWHGQGGMALAEDAPLKKIFILEHATYNQAVRLSIAQAVATLLVRTFAPLWSVSAMDFTLQFLEELCQTVPCFKLGFVPDHNVVEYVRCLSLD